MREKVVLTHDRQVLHRSLWGLFAFFEKTSVESTERRKARFSFRVET